MKTERFFAVLVCLLALVTFFCMTSCTVTKNIVKKKNKHDTSVVDHFTINTHVVDNSVTETTTTISADTNIQVKSDTGKASIQIGDTTSHRFQEGNIEIETKFNPKTNRTDITATTKAQTIPIYFQKTTTVKQANKIVTNNKQKNDIKEKGTVKTSDKVVDKKTTYSFPWWLFLLIALLVVSYWGYSKYKKVKKLV